MISWNLSWKRKLIMDKKKIDQIRPQTDAAAGLCGRWENFNKTVCRAMESCETSGINNTTPYFIQ